MSIERTYDDSEWTPGEMSALAGIAFADLDDTDYSEYLDTPTQSSDVRIISA